MKIRIGKKTYAAKYSLRALFIFEHLAGKSFELKTLMDVYLFYYSMLLAGSADCDLAFDAFIDACDADRTLPEAFNRYMDSATKIDGQFVTGDSDAAETDGKKKVI